MLIKYAGTNTESHLIQNSADIPYTPLTGRWLDCQWMIQYYQILRALIGFQGKMKHNQNLLKIEYLMQTYPPV